MLYIAGIALAYFLFLLVLTKKGKNKADRILTFWLFIIATHLALFYFRISNQLPPQLLGIEMPLPLLHGPLLFWYTLVITGAQPKRIWIHFLPAVIDCLYLLDYIMLPNEEKLVVVQNTGQGYEAYMAIKFSAIVVSGFGYVIASFIRLRKHKRNIENEFSTTDKVNLNWLSYLIYGLMFIWLLVPLPQEEPLFVGVVIFIFFLGFFGIKQVGIFHHTPITVASSAEKEDATILIEKKYEKSGLSEQKAFELRNKLFQKMTQEKLFRQSELTLPELAEQLDAQPNHLSQVLNDLEEKSFYDYINGLRIEEFKKQLANPESQKLTIMGIAENCGFNSKSSFNRYFKKVTGISPSEYLKTINSVEAY